MDGGELGRTSTSDETDDTRSIGGRRVRKWTAIALMALLAVAAFTILVATAQENTDNSYMDDADYVGSTRCNDCHDEKWDTWVHTYHATAFGPATTDSVVGDFSVDPVLELSPGVEVTVDLMENGTGYWVDLEGDGTYLRVDYCQGAGYWLQVYLTTIGDSQYILPLVWVTSLDAWAPFHAEEWYDTVTGEPKTVSPSHTWDRQCVACHATNVTVERNATSGAWEATWSEAGVTCESCHGPGSTHAVPPSGEDRTDYIWRTVSSDLCGNCHTGLTSVGTLGGEHSGYPMDAAGNVIRPGDDHADFFTLSPDLHPDGETVKGQAMQYNDYITSRHSHSLPTLLGDSDRQDFCLMCHSTDYRLADEGDEPTLETAEHDIECALCHDSHGTEQENNLRVDKWDTCVQCHRNGDRGVGEDPLPSMREMVEGTIPVEGLEGDPWMGGGVICTDCHMPTMGVRAVPYDIPSHTWHFVSPEKSIDLGMPNSCTVTCHGDGSTEGALTDEEALAYVEDAMANADAWMLKANGNVTIAGDRLDVAESLGFDAGDVAAYLETYNETLFVVEFVKRDGSRVHNPAFYELLLSWAYEESLSIHLNLTPGNVVGRVLDAKGKAVAGAELREGDKVWATTDGNGEFNFEIVPGEHTFEVWQDGKRKLTSDPEDVTAATQSDLGDLKFKEKKDDGPGFGLAVALLAIAALAALAALASRPSGR